MKWFQVYNVFWNSMRFQYQKCRIKFGLFRLQMSKPLLMLLYRKKLVQFLPILFSPGWLLLSDYLLTILLPLRFLPLFFFINNYLSYWTLKYQFKFNKATIYLKCFVHIFWNARIERDILRMTQKQRRKRFFLNQQLKVLKMTLKRTTHSIEKIPSEKNQSKVFVAFNIHERRGGSEDMSDKKYSTDLLGTTNRRNLQKQSKIFQN